MDPLPAAKRARSRTSACGKTGMDGVYPWTHPFKVLPKHAHGATRFRPTLVGVVEPSRRLVTAETGSPKKRKHLRIELVWRS